MAQFDVFRNPDISTADAFPYLLDVQHDIHHRMRSRLVVPLSLSMKPVAHLTPVFEIEGNRAVMSTMDMVSVTPDIFGEYVVNIKEHRTAIIDALDFLVNGF